MRHALQRPFQPETIYLTYCGATSLLFSLVFTVSGLYLISMVNLDPLQLVLVGTVLEVSVFFFEVPTGLVADLYSRKLSVIIGLCLVGAGFALQGSVATFVAALAAQVLWGLGYTFTSGADQAWIADEIGEDGDLETVFLKASQVRQLTAFFGILAAVALGSIGLRLPIILSGGLFVVLALILARFMSETRFKPAHVAGVSPFRSSMRQFVNGLQSIRQRSILMILVAIGFIYGLYSEGLDRLWEPHLLQDITLPTAGNLEPVAWFGIINAGGMILGIFAVEFLKRRTRETGRVQKTWVLLGINLVLVVSVFTFALVGQFALALSAYWLSSVSRKSIHPLYSAWANQNIDSAVRATVLSTMGQISALGQIVGGPFVGLIARQISISAALVVSGLMLTPVLALLAYAGPAEARNTTSTREAPLAP